MEPNIFSPKIPGKNEDKLSNFFISIARNILIVFFGLVPIFFIPNIQVSELGFSKVSLIIFGLFAATVFGVLAILRKGKLALTFLLPLLFFASFLAIALASAFLSGDKFDSLFGKGLDIGSAGFFMVLLMIMFVSLLFINAKKSINRLYGFLLGSVFLLQVFHSVRLFVSSEFLSFGTVFTANTSSPIGSLNDLAILSGLSIMLVFVQIHNLSRTRIGSVLSILLILNSLLLLAVINFYSVWIIVGFGGLLAILYSITKDTWFKSDEENTKPVSKLSLGLIGLVCLFSAAFVINGEYFSGVINKISGINYIEIRPSFESTVDITKDIYKDNILLGVGPNRFEDAWRQYKNPIINETIFWNTNFSSGSSYVMTIFATTGIAGGVLFVLFLISFLHLGYRSVFATEAIDDNWRMITIISFVAALYLWLLSLIYVPGATVLMLTALATGVFMTSYISNKKLEGVVLDVSKNKKYGLLLITGSLVIVLLFTGAVTSVIKQFTANINYIKTVNAFNAKLNFDEAEVGLLKSQNLSQNDLFVSDRARLRLVEISRLGSVEVTEEVQTRYNQMLSEGIELANQAISLDNLNPDNYVLLSSFLALLNPANFEGVTERNEALLIKAMELDPVNPVYYLLLAQHKARLGQLDETRKNLLKAVELKKNYTDALYLLSQLDIEEGNIESALKFTRSIITLEPNNPTRHFQLGLLLAANKDLEEAAITFERVIDMSPDYANARYFLALTYLDLGRQADALDQLRIVLKTNPDNELVKTIIAQVEAGEYVRPENSFGIPVKDNQVVNQDNGIVTTTESIDSELVTPVNRQTDANDENGSIDVVESVDSPVVDENKELE
jgi:tetratricopeptide (TPR) repeat protein